jgi:hypothetical protein
MMDSLNYPVLVDNTPLEISIYPATFHRVSFYPRRTTAYHPTDFKPTIPALVGHGEKACLRHRLTYTCDIVTHVNSFGMVHNLVD